MISVIVPVYNVYPYLQKCVDSICNQTYRNLEIILVNDGSTDGSENMCDSFLSKDNRIKVFHQSNLGLSAARNTGLEKSSGDYIVFVDSDDYIHAQMIECLYYNMKQYDADISICSHKKVEERENVIEEFISDMGICQIFSGRECVKKMYSPIALDMVVAWNKLYKKEYLLKYRYPVGRKHEDEFTTYRILMPLNKCVYSSIPLYFYRQRQGSIKQQKFSLWSLDTIDFYKERMDYLRSLQDKELYNMTLRRYETAIAEMILGIMEYYPEQTELLEKLEKQFRNCWKNEIVKADIGILHKLKYMLFMINKPIYKKLKQIGEMKKE